MRLHLNHRSTVRAVSITLIALLLGLGTLAPGVTADVLTASVDDGGSGASSGSAFVPQTQDRLDLELTLTESEEQTSQEVISGNSRQLLLIEGKEPGSAFSGRGKDRSEYCYRCFSYR